MSSSDIVNLMQSGIFEVLKLIAPCLIPALIVGLIVAIFQAVTSIQEQTLTFLPKLVTILLVLAFVGGLMFTDMGQYTRRLFEMIPQLAM